MNKNKSFSPRPIENAALQTSANSVPKTASSSPVTATTTTAVKTAAATSAPAKPATSAPIKIAPAPKPLAPPKTVTTPPPKSSQSKELKKKTRVVVKYDVGFGNQLFIRGNGASLSWEKGVRLSNLKADEWVWETETDFTSCEFKVLINDRLYESGANHPIRCGTSIQYTPKF